ncbi:MAG: PepSY-associated TM helix domain-containing protein [Spongiibacteraceae bacterium]|jgi:uncharacterized iron-regulated membrane protein|nr:PepSY-associated TM helix domain-containing protein [Spongiibacteraceae bacterium]
MRLPWKRWLFLTHRWLGIALALVVTAWFFSGIVMLYVPFPELTPAERRAGLAVLDFSTAQLTPAEAAAAVGLPPSAWPVTVRFRMQGERPVYQFGEAGSAVFADSGEQLEPDGNDAAAAAIDFHARRTGSAPGVASIELIEYDQWSLSSAFRRHLPLYRVQLDDPAGHHYYVSSLTGEVLLDTARRERLLNYFGAVTHWLYPTVLRRYSALWSWLVEILAGLAVVMTLTGLWMGWLQWKRKRAPGKRVPYRGLARWHYFAGVIFGIPALTWSFSGLLSMNPGNLNPWRAPDAMQRAVLAGALEHQQPGHFDTLLRHFPADAVAAQSFYIDGEPRLLVTHQNGRRSQLDPAGRPVAPPSVAMLAQRLAALLPEETAEIEQLDAYDNYYKPRRHAPDPAPLPVLRVRFDDQDATWFHIDPFTGQIIDRLSASNRLYRWLYNGLHSWDFLWLVERRLLWDSVIIVLCSGGFALSLSGVILGYRRIFGRRHRARARIAPAVTIRSGSRIA